MEQPSSDNAAPVVTDNPSQGPATPAVTAPTAPTTQPTEAQAEAFTNIDPSKLPPELKGSYDSMLSDYRKKTAEIAQQRKDYEAALEKAKQFDVLASDQEIVEMVNKKYSQPQPSTTPYNNEFIDPVVAERLSKLESELTVRDARLVVKDFQAQHQDFNDYKDLITGYVKLNPPRNNSEKEMQRVLEEGYNYFKGLKEQWRGEGRKEGLSRVAEKANQATLAPSPAVPGAYTGEAKKLSVSEAVELARKGQKVNAGQW